MGIEDTANLIIAGHCNIKGRHSPFVMSITT